MKKRFSQLLLVVAFGTVLFPSCSKDNETLTGTTGDEKAEIRLTTAVTTHTRSTLQNTQIEAGQDVGFFSIDVTDPTNIYYSNNKLTADGSGNFAYATKMYYPTNGNNVTFLAYHPYKASLAGLSLDDLASNPNFAVEVDQTIQKNYLNSDMLYATTGSVSKTNATIPLVFKHAFSKLLFTIKKGDGATLEGLSAIEVLNITNEANLNVTNGSVTLSESPTPTTIKSFNVPAGTDTDTELKGAAVIILPQEITKSTPLFKIRIGNVDYTYSTPSTGGHTFDAGKAYSITLTMNMAGITVSSEIVDWETGDSITGEGEID